MTTATDTPTPHAAGAALLQELLAALPACGYRKAAVDTWRNDAVSHNLRHAYTGGEWTLTTWYDGDGAIEHRYGVRAEMPALATLVSAVVAPPF